MVIILNLIQISV